MKFRFHFQYNKEKQEELERTKNMSNKRNKRLHEI